MDFTVGENVEAVDQLGVWANAKIIEKRDVSVVVTFPPWKPKWDLEIVDSSEVRKRTKEEILVPRRFASNKSPNLKKLLAGDRVYLAGEDVAVHWCDPIRKSVTVKLCDATFRTVYVWELETSGKDDQNQEPTRKRKRKRKNVASVDQMPPTQQSEEPHQPAVIQNGTFDFCFRIEHNGTVIRLGSFYTLAFSGNSIFVCSNISRLAHQFTFKFILCSLVNDKVDNFIQDVTCSIKDPQQISCANVTCNSKVRNLVDKLICEGWDRVLSCQESNIGNVSYLLDLRKSSLASQMRQGVWSGISRTATRPSQPIHLGVFDPALDTQIFGLSSKNQFQLVYKGKDIARLDTLLGALWDVKILEPGNPQSHFKYVCQIRLFVHKSSMSLRFNFAYSESNVPFTAAYRSLCIY